MKVFLPLIVILLFVVQSFGQQEKAVTFCFHFHEVYAPTQLEAKLSFQNQQVKFPVRDTCISIRLRVKRSYQLILEAAEYATAIIPIRDDTLHANQTFYVELLPRTQLLREIVVRPDNRMHYRGDTLVIDVDSVKMKPHGNTNDLLKKIPGIRITADGSIQIAGNEVQSVTVNGYELFGGNAKATLETIKGDMIKSLEVTAGRTPNSVTLNLKLKPDRNKGSFGEATLGKGTQATYTGEVRINKIAPKGFTNFFFSGNNTSEKVNAGKASEQINAMVLNNELGGVYAPSVNQLGIYVDLYAQRGAIPRPNLARDKGINNAISTGFNITRAVKKMNWSAFVLSDYTHQQLREENKTFQQLSETTEQHSESSSQRDTKTLQTWAAINGTIRPTRRDRVQVFSLFQLQQNDVSYQTQNRFILQENNANLLDNLSNRAVNELNNSGQFMQKIAWIHRYQKPDVVTAFYGSYHITHKELTQHYQNHLADIQNNQQIHRTTPDGFLDLQMAQSYPIWKGKLLVESKAIYQDALATTTQQALNFDNAQQQFTQAVSGLSINNFKVRDVQKEVQLNSYFLTTNSKLIVGLSLWNWHGTRQGYTPDDNLLFTSTKLLPTALWRWNFSEDNFFAIFYNKSSQLPTNEQTYPLADSSMIQATQIGNIRLLNYAKASLGIDTRYVFPNKVISNFSLNYTENDNAIINQTALNSNETLTQRYVQNNTIKLLSGRLSLLRLSRTKAGWHVLTTFSLTESPAIYENQTIISRSMFATISTGLKLKPSENISLDMDFQSLYTGQLSTNNGTWRTLINLKSEIELGYRTYLDLILDLNLNTNTVGKNVNYPLCEVALSQYVLKRNAIKLTLKARNLFDVKNLFESYSFGNAQYQYFYNQMPQFFVLSGTFYVEKWAKKTK